MNSLKRIVGFFLKIHLLLVTAILLLTIIPRLIGIYPYVVLSGSMEPKIHTGSLIYVNVEYPYENLKIDDVIAFEIKEGTLVTHRIVGMKDGLIETKGDSNRISDGFVVHEGNYRGLEVASLPMIGYGFRFLSGRVCEDAAAGTVLGENRGLILYVTIVLALFLLEYVLDYIQENERKEEMVHDSEVNALRSVQTLKKVKEQIEKEVSRHDLEKNHKKRRKRSWRSRCRRMKKVKRKEQQLLEQDDFFEKY